VLLLDDGFQHRTLARDEDVLVLGGRAPLGNGELLPLGPLREPPEAAARATVAWLNNVDEEESLPAKLPARRIHSRTRAVDVTDWHGKESFGPEALHGQKVFLLAGLGRPSGFERTLHELGAEVVGRALYGDHHPYSAEELTAAAAEAARLGASCVATTEKDAVRMEKAGTLAVPVRVVRVDLELLDGEDVLEALLGC
jgi:tetraacyldisaccharide 4'-kinase